MAEYQAELTSASSQIDDLEIQIGSIERSMEPYRAGIEFIEDVYPNLVLPPDIFNEYERLRVEWNRLNNLRNGLIVQMNALVEQHNRTVEESTRLTEATNKLIEDLAWLP